ncbi:MAG: hypothetical protein GXY59_11760 [Bacteroidales bacterium]|nr:hypothetical protein [Bacteroidales bacterium]
MNPVEQYIHGFPEEVRIRLWQVRDTILKAAPGAEETFAYMMPAYRLKGPLVYFAGFGKHIGFYPTPSGIEAFKEEISGYKYAKGSVQFPHHKPLPLDLIRRITEFRVRENLIGLHKKS